jgi:hypothetical protein
MTDQRCLTSAIAQRSALTAGPSSKININLIVLKYYSSVETRPYLESLNELFYLAQTMYKAWVLSFIIYDCKAGEALINNTPK